MLQPQNIAPCFSDVSHLASLQAEGMKEAQARQQHQLWRYAKHGRLRTSQNDTLAEPIRKQLRKQIVTPWKNRGYHPPPHVEKNVKKRDPRCQTSFKLGIQPLDSQPGHMGPVMASTWVSGCT